MVDHLSEMAANYLSDSITGSSMPGSGIQPDDIRQYGFLVDEYYQQFQGLSGPIWRGAWLLDVSPQRLQQLQQDKQVITKNTRRSWAFQIVSLLGMIVLICILYAVINAMTKGYYSVISAIMAIGLIVIFVLFLFLA